MSTRRPNLRLDWECCLACNDLRQALTIRDKAIPPVTPMFTLTCCLHFRDGRAVTATVKATSKTDDALVQYSGPVKRLPLVAPKATAIELRAYFKSFARELNARCEEQETDDRVLPELQLDEALEYLVALGLRRNHPVARDGASPRHPRKGPAPDRPKPPPR